MIKKHAVLSCIIISLVLIGIAISLYPGGSFHNETSVGFDWSKNFISDLFEKNAVNGAENPSRIWAIIAIAFHSLAYGIFFVNMSKKIINKHTSTVLKFIGIANILFIILIATPLHDIMVTLSSTLFLIALFYITVFIIKTKLHIFKVLCILCLMIFYFSLYLYGTQDLALLAIMQKVTFISAMLLIVGFEYFTKTED
jgi:hypothetical protein